MGFLERKLLVPDSGNFFVPATVSNFVELLNEIASPVRYRSCPPSSEEQNCGVSQREKILINIFLNKRNKKLTIHKNKNMYNLVENM
ncbi:MAG: hypothetical protein B7Y83_18965 [Flavobacteriales bacterium 32-34-25]|nr:MAG: hypothetical protein B7Y83_18965 [Flavobacteriales bacterium 32-34-25]